MSRSSGSNSWNPFKIVDNLKINACFTGDEDESNCTHVLSSHSKSADSEFNMSKSKSFNLNGLNGLNSSLRDGVLEFESSQHTTNTKGRDIYSSKKEFNPINNSNLVKSSISTIESDAAINSIMKEVELSKRQNENLEKQLRLLKQEINEKNAELVERNITETSLHNLYEIEYLRAKQYEDDITGLRYDINVRDSHISLALEKAEELANMYYLSQEEIHSIRVREFEYKNYILYLESKVVELTRSAEDLHSRIFKMQGNIKVFCRVRPLTATETTRSDVSDERLQEICNIKEYNVLEFNNIPFEFDRVMGPHVSQLDCYQEMLPVVETVMNGCRVCIFAYGQTGSGKTHTMEGPPEDRGVNLRSVETIFKLAELSASEFRTDVVVSIMEVYNERIIDLLGQTEHSPPPDPNSISSLEIRVSKSGGVYVEGLGQWLTRNLAEVEALLERGGANRRVASNNVNEHSSRSHLVVTVKVDRTHCLGGHMTSGVLYLVDLAGSERLKFTAAKGRQLKEAQHINRSLSAIGDVIAALASGHKHIPYRNSKLTFLLQDALKEHSHVLMIVNVTPLPEFVGESTYSLQFATRCRSVHLGQSRRVISYNDSSPPVTPLSASPPEQRHEQAESAASVKTSSYTSSSSKAKWAPPPNQDFKF